MKCAECVAEGERSIVYDPGGGWSTSMGDHRFYDEDGLHHIHDPNTTTMSYRCSRGHEWVKDVRRPCPAEGCDYGASDLARGVQDKRQETG